MPFNPFCVAGGIVTASMIQPDKELDERFNVVNNAFRYMSGNASHISYDNSAYLAEKSAGDKCYALGYNMRSAGTFPDSVLAKHITGIVDFYLQTQCIETDCEAMAVIAGTLANAGVCPVNHVSVLSPDTVKHTLGLMFSSGMNQYSGPWGFQVGLPAKNGSSGAILVVVPNVMGLVCYSPKLDPQTGISAKGAFFCHALTRRYNFHIFDQLVSGVTSKKEIPTSTISTSSSSISPEKRTPSTAASTRSSISRASRLSPEDNESEPEETEDPEEVSNASFSEITNLDSAMDSPSKGATQTFDGESSFTLTKNSNNSINENKSRSSTKKKKPKPPSQKQ
eukprot:TRINITY_DN1678_c0_g1_i1.p1 TRINITY_DN1678_c0_g1~~TRINITY_DN1678_c0_g1_i1.p1  ORF type:complete len:338 (-),score=93.46 TRINITY_DN1678_c0_g1_i1:1060-2073(-)